MTFFTKAMSNLLVELVHDRFELITSKSNTPSNRQSRTEAWEVITAILNENDGACFTSQQVRKRWQKIQGGKIKADDHTAEDGNATVSSEPTESRSEPIILLSRPAAAVDSSVNRRRPAPAERKDDEELLSLKKQKLRTEIECMHWQTAYHKMRIEHMHSEKTVFTELKETCQRMVEVLDRLEQRAPNVT